MDHREGADKTGDVRLDFDRRVRLEFHEDQFKWRIAVVPGTG